MQELVRVRVLERVLERVWELVLDPEDLLEWGLQDQLVVRV